ncbi:MAG: hypothetical protein IJ390_06300 [Lachnospiraceae bacterium]|nr:hypothetical protein [Lachnospiraceae bacterium]
MTNEDKAFLDRITSYANEKMPDLDPQKTHVSVQLETLKPMFEQIAKEQGVAVEDIFIKYMDLANEAFIASDKKLKDAVGERLDDGSIFRFG